MEDHASETESCCFGEGFDEYGSYLSPSQNALYASLYAEQHFDTMSYLSGSPFQEGPGTKLKVSKRALDDVFWGEESEAYQFFRYYTGEHDEWSPAKSESGDMSESSSETSNVPPLSDADWKRVFVHSSPTQFSDIKRARKSVFGSIFLKAPGQATEEAALIETVAASNYAMVHSMLNSFERVLASLELGTERRQLMEAYRESMFKLIEEHGLVKTNSDGSVIWDICPIMQDYLFSIQIADRTHQTRNLSRIEDRIMHGPEKYLRSAYKWSTGSIWTGHWDELGMAGTGCYVMPHGVTYYGKMKDGVFHDDDATLVYPNKFKALHCVYRNGKMLHCQFQFADNLLHEKENWNYCTYPDRRFFSEVRNGLKPGRLAQKTEMDPARRIWPGCYDTGEGFYNPKAHTLTSPSNELLRVPLPAEEEWIKKHCRKAFAEETLFRADFYQNWFNHDTEFIQSILSMQEKYKAKKITFEELQQFYVDHSLLPHLKKKRDEMEAEREEYLKTIPNPVALRGLRNIRKLHHRQSVVLGTDAKNQMSYLQSKAPKEWQRGSVPENVRNVSKAFQMKVIPSDELGASEEVKDNFTPSKDISNRSSLVMNVVNSNSSQISESHTTAKRQIPDRFLEYRQVLKAAFDRKSKPKAQTQYSRSSRSKKKCSSHSSNLSDSVSQSTESKELDTDTKRKYVEKYVKNLVLEAAMVGPYLELKRRNDRFMWAGKVIPKPKGLSAPKAQLKLMKEIYESIPDREEYCDSFPLKTMDLSEIAKDKYKILKYWGERTFALDLKI